jgi:hypothetical protein
MLGILIAPVVVALLIAFVEIYRERLAALEPGDTPPVADSTPTRGEDRQSVQV